MYAAKTGDDARVQLLLKHGADVHAGGDAALKYAVGSAHAAAARLLVARGADVSTALEHFGRTPRQLWAHAPRQRH
jgi:ankyrin repeat protein